MMLDLPFVWAGLIAFAVLAHEVALMACIAYPAYVLAVARPNRWHALILVGLAAVCLDPIVHGAMGDPWARVAELRAAQTVQGVNSDVGYSGLNLAWVGEGETALELLERALAGGFTVPQILDLDPWLAKLRSEARFVELRETAEAGRQHAQELFERASGPRLLGL